MVIRNCPNCGGEHWGSTKCPYIEAPCVVCGDMTVMACSDCSIESGGEKSVHVCADRKCQDEHERLNPQHPKTGYGENYGRKVQVTPWPKPASDQERVADFLAITHSDCNLHSLPDKVPPLSGQATKASYMDEAARIIALLRPQSLTH